MKIQKTGIGCRVIVYSSSTASWLKGPHTEEKSRFRTLSRRFKADVTGSLNARLVGHSERHAEAQLVWLSQSQKKHPEAGVVVQHFSKLWKVFGQRLRCTKTFHVSSVFWCDFSFLCDFKDLTTDNSCMVWGVYGQLKIGKKLDENGGEFTDRSIL
jgi:hypothetical protein